MFRRVAETFLPVVTLATCPSSFTMSATRKALTFTLLLCLVAVAGGQVSPGMPNFAPIDSHEVDSVDLLNNNVMLNVPVYSKKGLIDFAYGLVGDFYYTNVGGTWDTSFSAFVGGLSGSLYHGINPGGASYFAKFTTAGYSCSTGGGTTNRFNHFTIQTADGTVHPLPPSDFADYSLTRHLSCLTGSGFTDTTIDGSGLVVTVSATGTLVGVNDRHGTSVTQTSFLDTRGNSISQGVGGAYTDTLGVQTFTAPDQYNGPFSWTDSSNGTQQVSFGYPSTLPTLRSNFGCTNVSDFNNTVTSALPNVINLPDSTSVGLVYESTPGFTTQTTGRLQQLTLREGGTITYSYGGAHNGIDCTYQTVPVLTRTLGNGDTTTYTLAYSLVSGAAYKAVNTVVDPGGNQTNYTFSGFSSTGPAELTAQVLTEVDKYLGTSTLLTTDWYCYNLTFSNCPALGTIQTVHYPISSVIVFHKINGMSTSSASETDYDGYGNVTFVSYYDFGGTSPATSTAYTYGSWNGTACVAVANGIYDTVCEVLKRQNGQPVGESLNTYDPHGSLTKSSFWNGTSWFGQTVSNVYNSNGTLSKLYDASNNEVDYYYSASSYSGCPTAGCTQLPFPTEIATGSLTTYMSWYAIGGVKNAATDINGGITTYSYTGDQFWRPITITDPLLNVTSLAYGANYGSSSFAFNSGNSINYDISTLDAYGRLKNRQTEEAPSSTVYDTTSKSYGWSSSHLAFVNVSEPCAIGLNSSCTSLPHALYIDPLGRLDHSTTTNNETIQNTYTQQDVLTVLSPSPANENNKQVQNEYDGLGRLIKSCAVGSVSGSSACNQSTGSASGITTSFAYSAASGSTTVTATRAGQVHTTVRDALGRITRTVRPESGTWKYVYDSDTSCPAGYTGTNGLLASSTDSNGNRLCFAYDGLSRVIGINADTTTCRHFYFDSSFGTVPTGVTTPTYTQGRLAEASTDNCSGSLLTDEWFSYDKNGHVIDQWESTPNSGRYYHSTAAFFETGALKTVQLANPNLYTVTYTLDGKGRPNSFTNGTRAIVQAAGVTYDAADRPTQILLGASTDKDTYSYDATTGRMTSFGFYVNTNSQTAGTSTMPGIIWNPNLTLRELNITDTANAGDTEDCKFGDSSNAGYDDLGRLMRDDCGTGKWGQTFGYDQYDNIGKNTIAGHIGSTFNGMMSSTNNRMTVTGTTYDSNGNNTTDSVGNVFAFDEFSKVKTAGGTSIVYDAFGRAVELSGATQIWYTQAGKTAYMSGATYNYAYWPTAGGGTHLHFSSSYQYLHKDWLGNARIVSSIPASGSGGIIADQAYSPYGELYAVNGSAPVSKDVMFTGIDSAIMTGGTLYDTSNRELTFTGRWLNPDPLGSSWNAYAYPTNPNTNSDPSGLCQGCRGVPFKPWMEDNFFGDEFNFLYNAATPAQASLPPDVVHQSLPAGVTLEQYFDSLGGGNNAAPDTHFDVSILTSFQPAMVFWGPNHQAVGGCSGPGAPCRVSKMRTFAPRQFPWATSFQYTVLDVNNNVVPDVTSVTEYWEMMAGDIPNDGNHTWNSDNGPLNFSNVANGSYIDTYGSFAGYRGRQMYSATWKGIPYVIETTNDVLAPQGGAPVSVTPSNGLPNP